MPNPRAFSSAWLAARSIAWAVAFPGVIAGVVPWRYFGLAEVRFHWLHPLHLLGALAIGIGAGLLTACIREFARSGRGTLAAFDPPRELVASGLYRHVRNPMVLSVATIVLGEWLLTRSSGLLLYLAIWFAAVNLFVMGYEEPALRARFGESYERYTREVRRWIPTLRPRRPDRSSGRGEARGGGARAAPPPSREP